MHKQIFLRYFKLSALCLQKIGFNKCSKLAKDMSFRKVSGKIALWKSTINAKIFVWLRYSYTLVWSSHRRCSVKKDVIKNLANFTEKHPCWSHFLIKLKACGMQLYLKETPTQVFSCEICEIFKSTYFDNIWKRLLLTSIQTRLRATYSESLKSCGPHLQKWRSKWSNILQKLTNIVFSNSFVPRNPSKYSQITFFF